MVELSRRGEGAKEGESGGKTELVFLRACPVADLISIMINNDGACGQIVIWPRETTE